MADFIDHVVLCDQAREIDDPHARLKRWQHGDNAIGTNYQIKTLKAERDRLLILATKHCPIDHHDWDELLGMQP